jgi:hypothetical protein
MKKVKYILAFAILFIAVISFGQENLSFAVYSNSGEKLESFYSLEKSYKYLVITPEKEGLNEFTTKLTHVSDGLGKKQVAGDKVIKLTDEFINGLKTDDYLSIEVLNNANEAIHYINLKVKD